MKLLTNLDLVKNQLLNAVIQVLATAPSTPSEGQIYYDSVAKSLFFFNGTTWESVMQGSDDINDIIQTAPINVSITNGVATISISAATTSSAGSMSASDKTKLDDATASNTASKLVIRDANGRSQFSDPASAQDAATKSYVDGLVDNSLKAPEAYDPTVTSDYPLTYNSNAIQKGDSFRITSAGVMGGINVNTEDLLIALIDAPDQTDANWQVLESNRDQATETVKGVAEISTQAEVTTGTDDSRIVTPLKLRNEINSQLSAKPTKYVQSSFVIGTAASPAVITHNLGTRNIVASVYDTTTFEEYYVDIYRTSINTVTVYSTGTPKTVNVTIIG